MRLDSPTRITRSLGGRTLAAFATVAILTVLLTGCGGAVETSGGLVEWPNRAEEVGPAIGMLAPNFSLPTASGEAVTLSETVGSPIIITFFASWCESCREEMALFERANQAGTTVIGVDLRETADVVQALAKETGATFPLALDRSGDITRAYKVTSLPATYLLDGKGRVVTMVRGPLDDEGLASLLAMTGGEAGDA